MMAPPDKAKYKRLRVAVQSFTHGFTSVMWPAFGDLASNALSTGVTCFDIDFLSRTIAPPPPKPVCNDFFDYRDLAEWFDSVGCSLQHVARFQMQVTFDPATTKHYRWETSHESFMRFHAHTEIDSDRGQTYRYDYDSGVWFDFALNE